MKRLLVFLPLILSTTLTFGLTRAEIREQVRYHIQDTTDTTNSPTWSDDILDKRINIVQREICIYTKALYGRCLITPTTNQQEYRMPDDLVTIDRLSYFSSTSATDTYKKLTWTSMVNLDVDYPSWETQGAGQPLRYYERRNFIGLNPKPAGNWIRTKAIKIDYYKLADNMDSDTNEPFDSDYSLRGYHYLVVIGVVIQCKKDLMADRTLEIAEYNSGLKTMAEYIKTKPDRQERLNP